MATEKSAGKKAPTAPKKLYKARKGRVIDGVCAGLAAYSGIDVTLVRLVMVLLALMGGIGLILYLTAVVIVPRQPGDEAEPETAEQPETERRNILIWGVVLVLAGIFLMGFSLKIFNVFSWNWWDSVWRASWPLSVFISGLILILFPWLSGLFGKSTDKESVWYRSASDRKILGVCGGLAAHIKADPNLIRFLWVAVIFFTSGLGLLVYFIVALFLPEKSSA